MADKRTAEEVKELLQRYQKRGSGITRRAFCEGEEITLSMLDYYLRRRATPTVRLARVRVTNESAADSGRYVLVLANGRRIECGPAELPQLIAAAERA